MVPPLHPPQKKMATCSFHYFHSKLLHLACFVQRNIYKWASVKGWRAGFWEGFPQRLALFGEPINYIKRQTSSIRRSNFRRRYPEVSNHILVGNISCCIVLLQFQIQQVSKIPSNLSQLEPRNYPFNPKNSYQIILASPDLGLYEWNHINFDDVGDDDNDEDDDEDEFEILHASQAKTFFDGLAAMHFFHVSEKRHFQLCCPVGQEIM